MPKKAEIIELKCKHCGKTFKKPKSVLKTGRGKYCSTECRLKGMNVNNKSPWFNRKK